MMYQETKDLAFNSKAFPAPDLARTLFGLFFRYITPFRPVIDRVRFETRYADRLHERDSDFARLLLAVCAVASVYCKEDSRVYHVSGAGQRLPGYAASYWYLDNY